MKNQRRIKSMSCVWLYIIYIYHSAALVVAAAATTTTTTTVAVFPGRLVWTWMNSSNFCSLTVHKVPNSIRDCHSEGIRQNRPSVLSKEADRHDPLLIDVFKCKIMCSSILYVHIPLHTRLGRPDIKHHSNNDVQGRGGICTSLCERSVLYCRAWFSSTPLLLYPQYPLDKSWVDYCVTTDAVSKKKKSPPPLGIFFLMSSLFVTLITVMVQLYFLWGKKQSSALTSSAPWVMTW